MSKLKESMPLSDTRSRLRVVIIAVTVLGLASFAFYAGSAWISGFHEPMVTAVVSSDTLTVFDENGEASRVLFRSTTR